METPEEFVRKHTAWSNETRAANAQEDTARNLETLVNKQHQMVQATFDVVQEQQNANKLQKESNDLLKTQIILLAEQNKKQVKQLKKDRFWNIFAWIITTAVAIAAIVVPLLK